MELGRLGMDLAVLEGWKTRALQIVRSSRHPARSMRLLRDKAAAMFDCAKLQAVSTVKSLDEGCVPPRQLNKGNSFATGREERFQPFVSDQQQQQRVPAPVSLTPVVIAPTVRRGERFEEVRPPCQVGGVFPVAADQVDGLQAMDPRIAGFTAAKSRAAKPCLSGDFDIPAGTLYAIDMITVDGQPLQVDDEPPDPGIFVLQKQGYVNSDQGQNKGSQQRLGVVVGERRQGMDLDLDEEEKDGQKKARAEEEMTQNQVAGLSEQLREQQ